MNYKSPESSFDGRKVDMKKELRRPSFVSRPQFRNSGEASSEEESDEDESVKELQTAKKAAKIKISEDYVDDD